MIRLWSLPLGVALTHYERQVLGQLVGRVRNQKSVAGDVLILAGHHDFLITSAADFVVGQDR